jgi:hypothetical protein
MILTEKASPIDSKPWGGPPPASEEQNLAAAVPRCGPEKFKDSLRQRKRQGLGKRLPGPGLLSTAFRNRGSAHAGPGGNWLTPHSPALPSQPDGSADASLRIAIERQPAVGRHGLDCRDQDCAAGQVPHRQRHSRFREVDIVRGGRHQSGRRPTAGSYFRSARGRSLPGGPGNSSEVS